MKFVNMTSEYPVNLPLRIIITGNNFPTDIQLSNPQVLTSENPIKFTAKVTNRTSKVIQKYTVKWTIDGKTEKAALSRPSWQAESQKPSPLNCLLSKARTTRWNTA